MTDTGSYSRSRPMPSLADELDEALGDQNAGDLPPTAFMVGLSGKHAGKLFRIKPGDSIIGRSSKALVTIDEKAVSHRHAKLTLTQSGCKISDLKSTNGSFVNDARVEEARDLQAGDVLRFGTSTFGYLTDAEDEEQHTRALARVTAPTFQGSAAVPLLSPTGATQVREAGLVPASSADGEIAPYHAGAVLSPEGPPVNPLDDALDKLALATGFLKQYWILILATSLAGTGLGATMVKLKPPPAIASFEITLHDDKTRNTSGLFASRSIEYFSSAEKTFSNLEVVKQTMRDMKLPTPANAVRGTAGSLGFEKEIPNSYIGTYRHPDARYAETFLAKHLKNYLEREIGKAIKLLRTEVDLLRTQYDDNSALLREYEGTLRDFKQKHLDSLPEVASGQMEAKMGLQVQRDGLKASLSRNTQALALARRQLASGDALLGSQVAKSQPYESRLVQLKASLATARAQGFADGHPDIIKLKEEEREVIALRDQALATESSKTDEITNVEQKRLRNEVAQLRITVSSAGLELSQVESRLANVNKVAGNMPEVEAELAEKIRAVEASKKQHGKLHEQLKAKELELQFERASVAARYEVLQPPTAFSTNIGQLMRKGALIGFGGGIVFGVLLGLFHILIVYARNRNLRITPPSLEL